MSRVSKIAALAALGATALTVAACSGSSKTEAELGCPKVMSPPETQIIALFGPNGHDARDVMVGGRIRNISSKCVPEKVGIAVQTQIDFEAQRTNPSITDATLPYFVALLDPDTHVLDEQGYKLDIKFLPGESYRRSFPEKITVHLPLKNKAGGSAYTVVVGFQLTPDQIAFNRAAHPQ